MRILLQLLQCLFLLIYIPWTNGFNSLAWTARKASIRIAAHENEDSAMSAYERAMASYRNSQNQGGDNNNARQDAGEFPDPSTHTQSVENLSQANDFVQSNFDDPMYGTEERENLERANQWTESQSVSTSNPMVEPTPQLNDPWNNNGNYNAENGMSSTQSDESNSYRYQGSGTSNDLPTYQQSFVDALSPNSENNRNGFTTSNDQNLQENPEESYNPSDQWEPLLTFTVKEDTQPPIQEQPQQQFNEYDPQNQQFPDSDGTAVQGQQTSNPPEFSTPDSQTTGQQGTQQRQYMSQPPQANAIPNPYVKQPPQANAISNPYVKDPPPANTASNVDLEQTPSETHSASLQNAQSTYETFTEKLEDETPIIEEEDDEEEEGPTFGIETIEPPTALNDFINTAWEEQQKQSPTDPIKKISEVTKGALGRKPLRKGTSSTSSVQPGATKRILEDLDRKNPNPNSFSQWAAFQNAERRWEDLKKSRKFRYDFKLLRQVQEGAGPPLQFISDDCARGNAKCCAKLRAACEKTGHFEECMDLDYEGPPLDDFGQPIMDYDVVVLGGTLGIFYGMALQLQGLKVCVATPRELKGQEQEWNVRMEDLLELQRLGILSPGDIEASVTTLFDGTRAGFKNKEVTPLGGGLKDNDGVGFECYLNGVLNLGVSPKILINRAAARFKAIGGDIRERCPLGGVAVSPQVGCAIDLGSYNPDEDIEPITAKLVLDCLGFGSPVSRQQRYGQRPDSICMVFGSNAGGYNPARNRFADAMYSFNGLQDFGVQGKHQYFWETFPVGTNLTAPKTSDKTWFDKVAFGNVKELPRQGPQVTSDVKTTYMFTYIDAHKDRPSLESLMDDYFKLLPVYQPSINNPETDLRINRVFYDYFPAYRDSPMKPQHSRVISVGEAAGLQSPISFGGFRSLSRHIARISGAVAEAVRTGCLHKDDLGEINAYLPNLSAAWLFRDVMSVNVGKGKDLDPEFTNRVLAVYMKAMYDSGPSTVSPLMHDVLRFDALVRTLVVGIISDPLLMKDLVKHLGISKCLEFLGHVWNMGLFSFMDTAVSPLMGMMLGKIDDPRTKFNMRRKMEAWKYGSGNDYKRNDRQ